MLNLKKLLTKILKALPLTGNMTNTSVAAYPSNSSGSLHLRKVGNLVIATGSISMSQGSLPMGTSSNPTQGQLFSPIPASYRPRANSSSGRGLLIGTESQLNHYTPVSITTAGIVYQYTSAQRQALIFTATWEAD